MDIDTSKVTRIEIIDQNGRMLVGYGFSEVKISMQDDGRTMKIFSKTSESVMATGDTVEAWKVL